MTGCTIRAARPEDADQICVIWNDVIANTTITFTNTVKTIKDITDMQDARPTRFWVAAQGQTIAGFATFGPFRSGPGYATTAEHSIMIAPSFQGQNIGRDLMQALLGSAQSEGIHVMVAAISGSNANAVQFHAALGFEPVGHLPQVGRKKGQFLDLILLQKILGPDPDKTPRGA